MTQEPLRQIRVLHVYKTYLPDTRGGVPNALLQICTATAAIGVQNTVLTLTGGRGARLLERAEAAVWRYRRNFEVASCPFSAGAALAFRGHLRGADIVHYHFPWPFADLLDLVRPATTPALVTYHSDVVRQQRLLGLYRPLMNRFLGRVGRIAATSPNYAASSRVLQAFHHKVRIVPLGLDEGTYPAPPPEKRAAWERRLGRNYFLFVGVLRYYKGLETLLAAAQGKNYPIVIVGQGPMEKKLKEQARRLGLANVEFAGFVEEEDKAALFSLCRAVVFPSHIRSEAFGMTLLEAAMFGKAMISAEIGTGTSFINVHGQTGLVVPPADPDSLRNAMQRLEGDAELADRMGRAARNRFEQLFTAERLGRGYRALYEELLQKTAAVPAE